MKIKEVCRQTDLTERTIRYYVERKLIIPRAEIINGREYRDYSQEDVKQLLIISELRKLYFSIEDISEMMDYPDKIKGVIEKYRQIFSQELEKKKNILEVLENVNFEHIKSVSQLVEYFTEVSEEYNLQEFDINPDFSKFDSETEEEKEEAYLDFKVSQRIRDKWRRFLKPIQKGLLSMLCISFIFCIAIALSGIPKDIEKNYAAIQCRVKDEIYIEHINIRIKGKLYKRLFSYPKFAGSIIIDGFEYTNTDQLNDVIFSKSTKGSAEMGALSYSSIKEGLPNIESLGAVWMSNNFEEITIWVFEPLDGDSKSSTDLIISAPAASREEAVEILERLSDYSQLHNIFGKNGTNLNDMELQ